jgi:hypothetical protein
VDGVVRVDWAPLQGWWRIADRAVLAVCVPVAVLGFYRLARDGEPPGWWWLPTVAVLTLLSVAIRGVAEWRRRRVAQ